MRGVQDPLKRQPGCPLAELGDVRVMIMPTFPLKTPPGACAVLGQGGRLLSSDLGGCGLPARGESTFACRRSSGVRSGVLAKIWGGLQSGERERVGGKGTDSGTGATAESLARWVLYAHGGQEVHMAVTPQRACSRMPLQRYLGMVS